ncbi:MAG: hypothetical protein C0411_23510 [Pseudomonas sp.]|nr:hypothetical protein [Pseudomonas sp.]MSU97648.1 hypothetical protein [Pseudomonas mandelii]TWS03450.1 hypothetical protein FJD35_31340 [Pseudomonas mandelii]
MARELAPAGWRSHPNPADSIVLTHRGGWFGPATQASGSKLPRHRGLWWTQLVSRSTFLVSRRQIIPTTRLTAVITTGYHSP